LAKAQYEVEVFMTTYGIPIFTASQKKDAFRASRVCACPDLLLANGTIT